MPHHRFEITSILLAACLTLSSLSCENGAEVAGSANIADGASRVVELAGPVTVAIENITVIDTTAATDADARISAQTVLISNDRIIAVGPAADTEIPANTPRIDGTDRFVIPGLWDMHVHLNRDRPSQVKIMLPLMVANGVTGVRDMLSDCWEPCAPGQLDIDAMRALQREIDDGDMVGPRIHSLSSAIISGHRGNPSRGVTEEWEPFFRPQSAEEARQVVRYVKARGVDFIKIYNGLPRPAFFALMDEARKLDVEVTGHLPWSLSPVEASNAGMRSIEHARFPALACGPDWEEFRDGFARFASLETDDFPREAFQKLRSSAIIRFDEARCVEILETLAANNTYLVPSHTTRKMDAFAPDPEYRADPRRKYVPPWRLAGWDRDLEATASGPPELLQFYREFFDLGLRVTGLAHRTGVKILAGTDTLDTQCFPGFSLHDELEHLIMAGLTPLDALKAATINAACFESRDVDLGSVTTGKLADLVVLDADPLQEIGNTRAIHAVILNGAVHDRVDLDRMLAGVEEFVASVQPRTRVRIDLDPALYDVYIGEYEFDGFILTVKREGDKLFIETGGQPPIEIVPESETDFFIEVADAQVQFVKDGDGSVNEVRLYQRGEESVGKRR